MDFVSFFGLFVCFFFFWFVCVGVSCDHELDLLFEKWDMDKSGHVDFFAFFCLCVYVFCTH